MEHKHHVEHHFASGNLVRDIVIGMSDGLTVPFALAAGLSGGLAGAANATKVVVLAGLAEVAAGSVAMGLGGYLAAKGDAEHYDSERLREQREVREIPQAEADEIAEIFEQYSVSVEDSLPVLNALKRNPEAWVDFMMKFELGLEKPERSRAIISALTIGGAYIAGGLIPLSPYMLLPDATTALYVSVLITMAALAIFGFIKGRFTGSGGGRSAFQTVMIGGIAAATAFTLARMFSVN